MGVVVADRAVHLGQQRDRGDAVARARQAHRDVADLLAERRRASPSGRACARASAASACSWARARSVATSASSAGSSTSSPRRLEHQRVAGVVDVLAGAGEVDELGRAGELRLGRRSARSSQYSTALTSWLVVLLDLLDRLARRPPRSRRPGRAGTAMRRRSERLEARRSRPSARAMNHSTSTWTRRCMQAVFAQQRPQRSELAGVAAVEGGQRGEGRGVHLASGRLRRGVAATAARRGEPAIICADPRMKPNVASNKEAARPTHETHRLAQPARTCARCASSWPKRSSTTSSSSEDVWAQRRDPGVEPARQGAVPGHGRRRGGVRFARDRRVPRHALAAGAPDPASRTASAPRCAPGKRSPTAWSTP